MKYLAMLLVVCAFAACTQQATPQQTLPTGCNQAFLGAEACTEQYEPVCATMNDGSTRTIGNECVACALTDDVVSIAPGACEEDDQPSLPGPIGGEDDFSSPQYTACEDPRPEVCTREYRPVCGLELNGVQCVTTPCPSLDANTYGNACDACANQNVQGHYPGSCEEVRFVVCQDTVTGFDPEEYAENTGGVCVDICPNNFDSYTTQTGIEVCITHYGEEEISEWPVCTESSYSCQCARASVTTDGQEIDASEYRCVPDQYAERMLFYSGLDMLDENGDNSVMIA